MRETSSKEGESKDTKRKRNGGKGAHTGGFFY